MSTTRRGALAALAATVGSLSVASAASARRIASYKPVVTAWAELSRRAEGIIYRNYTFTDGSVPTRAELDRQVKTLTYLVADLIATAADEHTVEEPR